MLRRPEEIDAAQEAQEKRRIAKRGQRAADIGDQEDEEDDGMCIALAVIIGAQERPDHHHRSTSRSGEARQRRP